VGRNPKRYKANGDKKRGGKVGSRDVRGEKKGIIYMWSQESDKKSKVRMKRKRKEIKRE